MPSLSRNSPLSSPISPSRPRFRSPSYPGPSSPTLSFERTRSPSFSLATVSAGGAAAAPLAASMRGAPPPFAFSRVIPAAEAAGGPGAASIAGPGGSAGTFSPASPQSAPRLPSTSPTRPPVPGLLVPTDRTLEDLEENWLPRLGKLKVDREVRISGYTLYGIRSWYLSRTHWMFTIAVSSGKPTDYISCYVLTPCPELSDAEGAAVLASAAHYLASETHGHTRKTEHGTLLVSSPAGYGQEISPIPTGDMRGAWPFIVLNTGLRRLGCGGRAAMGNDPPVPAVRRKFYESYGIQPPKADDATSPPGSPTLQHTHSFGHSHHLSLGSNNSASSPTAAIVWNDPLLLNTITTVKLIQGALALWGLFGPHAGDDCVEIDGLFCDETKAGIFRWRRVMGLEMDDAYKIERETSGGCIDPRTLTALLTSVTSVRYQLASLGVEKLPKDPFTNPRRFLQAWRAFPPTQGKYLSVSGIRALNACHVQGRKAHPTDALKVHRFLLSGVASATSSISNNLKGGASDDLSTPLRKREQHMIFGADDGGESGLGMIVPEAPPDTNAVSAPDTITSDIDAYHRLLLKSKEKEWDVMGARPIAELFKGQAPERAMDGEADRYYDPLRAFRRRPIQDDADDDGAVGATMGRVKGMRSKTGAALKGSFALVGVGRASKGMSDASDSEGASKGKKRGVPMVNVEADDDDVLSVLSRSPSPREPITPSPRQHTTYPQVHSPLQQSMRLSVAGTNVSGDTSDVSMGGSTVGRPSLPSLPSIQTGPLDRRRSAATAISTTTSAGDRSRAWASPQPRVPMLRTASDGADVVVAPGGNEFAVANPHGTGRREEAVVDGTVQLEPQLESDFGIDRAALKRTNSFQNRSYYRGFRIKPKDHLAVDVEMCALVWELRKKEKALQKRTEDMMVVEKSAFAATQAMMDAARSRRDRVDNLEAEVRRLQYDLSRAASEDVDEDRALQWASSKLLFFLSEDTNIHELRWQLRELEKHWESMREEREEAVEAVRREEAKPWWRLGY